jgi:hypothetical protein
MAKFEIEEIDPSQERKMGQIIVGNFGVKNGVQTYRVNGEKADLYRIIEECRKEGAKFDDTPHLEFVHNNQWSMLLKLKVAVSVGNE